MEEEGRGGERGELLLLLLLHMRDGKGQFCGKWRFPSAPSLGRPVHSPPRPAGLLAFFD